MKKLAILSPLVILMASTSLAQDSCITRPSCADMGYTKTIDDCTGKTTLKCPFDLTALFCPEGGTSNSEPETLTCDFGYLAKNGECTKIDNAIAFVLSVNTANGGVTLYTGTTSGYIVDWGDGTIDNSLSTSNPSHVYADVGEYQIVITGNVTSFYINTLTNSYPTRILNIDLDTVKTYGDSYKNKYGVIENVHPFNDCSNVTGEIPDEISPNLVSAIRLFDSCSGLTGEIPTLPNTITNAYQMFYGCSGLTGSIPNLPSSLIDGFRMFYNCSGLTGAIPTMPNTITNAYQMFYGCTGLTGSIPNLPSSLTEGSGMFYNCSGLTGAIPDLPTGLSEAKHMFYNCTGLTRVPSNLGSLTALKNGYRMFYQCENMGGTITGFPPNLEKGEEMFYRCFKLRGAIPDLPTSLEIADYMFFNDYYLTSLPSNLGELTNLTSAQGMFMACYNLSGEISALPPNIASASNMFNLCEDLTGTAPAFSNYPFTSSAGYNSTFENTQITNNTSDPWPDNAW